MATLTENLRIAVGVTVVGLLSARSPSATSLIRDRLYARSGDDRAPAEKATRPVDAVVTKKDQQIKELQLEPGERVVGRGQPIGTVYKLNDGRTVIVRKSR